MRLVSASVRIRMLRVRSVANRFPSRLVLIKVSTNNQVSECIKLLQTNSTLPIQRARMRIRVSIPSADEARLREKILEGVEKIEREGPDGDEWCTVRVPDTYRINSADLPSLFLHVILFHTLRLSSSTQVTSARSPTS